MQKQQLTWILSLYGTAIGAGVLFLPIEAGLQGIVPLIVMMVIAFPLTYFPHKALCNFVLSSKKPNANITDTVVECFGKKAGHTLTILYFFSIYPILLMYSVALTNTVSSFLEHQMTVNNMPPRWLLASILMLLLMLIIRLGQTSVIKAMSYLVYPVIIALLLIALYLVPEWNSAAITFANAPHATAKTLWLAIPVLIFSFNHSPIISSFAVSQREKYADKAEAKSEKILRYSHLLMVITVMFFVLSCVLSLSPQDLMEAKTQNISILSYIANHFKEPILQFVSPIIAIIAISKSFLGHYIGTYEGLRKIITKKELHDNTYTWLILLSCFIVATINPNILKMIETLCGPIIALLLFLMPMYAFYKIPKLKAYKHNYSNIFVTFFGLIGLSAIFYNLL
jgi:serine transporter